MTISEKRDRLHKLIRTHALVFGNTHRIALEDGRLADAHGWMFDMRALFLHHEALRLVADLFWEQFADSYPFQIAGPEISSIPFITAIILAGDERRTPVNGFVLRKSRKKVGLQKLVEGVTNTENVILVDDLTNNGRSLLRDIKVIEADGLRVSAAFPLVQFREKDAYTDITKRGTDLRPLFVARDFDINTAPHADTTPPRESLQTIWKYASESAPNRFFVVPKSRPALDARALYFGTDDGIFHALSQDAGEELWRFKTGTDVLKRGIFSSPAIHGHLVYFGAYDGDLYALNTATGTPQWRFQEADWIGSSPALAPNLGLLFIGLEYGLLHKQGGLAALDLKTGEKRWGADIHSYVHSSPLYDHKNNQVIVGSNDGFVYAVDGKTGDSRWRYQTNGGVKGGPVLDTTRNQALVGSLDGNLYALDAKSGKEKGVFHTPFGLYMTPLVVNSCVYFGGTDKHVYCIDLTTGSVCWSVRTGGRIFSTPVYRDGSIYIGSNDGRLYILDAETGAERGFFQASERIVNGIAYNEHTGKIFLPTHANEIYCLEEISSDGK